LVLPLETNSSSEKSEALGSQLTKGVARKSATKPPCLHPIRNIEEMKKIVVPENRRSEWLCTMHFKCCNHPTCNRKALLHKGKVQPENDIDKILLTTQDLCTFNIKAFADKRDAAIYITGEHCKEYESNVALLKKDILIKKDIEGNVLRSSTVKGIVFFF